MSDELAQDHYRVKLLFADASSLHESFPAGVTVEDAKKKMISVWPAAKQAGVYDPGDLRLIYNGKVLENSKSFEGAIQC